MYLYTHIAPDRKDYYMIEREGQTKQGRWLAGMWTDVTGWIVVLK